jgi:hypothetical protein
MRRGHKLNLQNLFEKARSQLCQASIVRNYKLSLGACSGRMYVHDHIERSRDIADSKTVFRQQPNQRPSIAQIKQMDQIKFQIEVQKMMRL